MAAYSSTGFDGQASSVDEIPQLALEVTARAFHSLANEGMGLAVPNMCTQYNLTEMNVSIGQARARVMSGLCSTTMTLQQRGCHGPCVNFGPDFSTRSAIASQNIILGMALYQRLQAVRGCFDYCLVHQTRQLFCNAIFVFSPVDQMRLCIREKMTTYNTNN